MLSFSISYWDIAERGARGWKEAQRQDEDRVTLRITLTYNCDFQRIEKSNKDLHDRGSFIKTAMGGFFWGGRVWKWLEQMVFSFWFFLKNQNWQFSESEIFRYPKLTVINKIKYMIGMNLVQIILCKMGYVTPESCEKVIFHDVGFKIFKNII